MERNTGKNEEGSSSTHRPASPQPEWVIDIRNHLKEEPLPNSGELCTISRVPPGMLRVDEDDYIPKLVSIGPFHHDNPNLKAMEKLKLRFLYGLLDPSSQRTHTVESSVKAWRAENMNLEGLEIAMKKLERKTRECYSEEFDALSSDKFVRMMVIDGCFIVELLRLHALTSKVDPILSTSFMLPELRLDLLMLENQLPLFVLRQLYTLTGPDQDEASFNDLAIKFFNPLVPEREEKEIEEYNVAGKEQIHLLALFQSSFIPENTQSSYIEPDNRSQGGPVRVPKRRCFASATKLWSLGISFRKKMGCFLEIGFVKAVFEIPPLFLDEGSTQFMRNAAAYEQCNKSAKPYFTSLAIFFDTLVDSPEDVELLRGKGIIQTLDSNENAADVLNKLTKGIVRGMDERYISEVVEKINQCTTSIRHRWRRILWNFAYNFLNQEPMKAFLFYLTVIQTFSSVTQFIFEYNKDN